LQIFELTQHAQYWSGACLNRQSNQQLIPSQYIAFYKATLLPDYDLSTLAWIGTIGTFQQLFWGAFAGKLCDMGYYRYLLLAASCLYILSFFSIASATKYWQLILCQGIGLGLAQGRRFSSRLAKFESDWS
jgi:MFS family permease